MLRLRDRFAVRSKTASLSEVRLDRLRLFVTQDLRLRLDRILESLLKISHFTHSISPPTSPERSEVPLAGANSQTQRAGGFGNSSCLTSLI